MSETSAEYRVGFAKLLPHKWQPDQVCTDHGQPALWSGEEILWCNFHGHRAGTLIPCPDIRKDKTAAWDALMAYEAAGYSFGGRVAQLPLPLRLYVAIEALGRTP